MDQQEFVQMCKDAVQKVIEQGAVSIKKTEFDTGSPSECLYKSDVGCCVVGHMMPDDKTRENADKLDSSGIYSVVQNGVWGKNLSRWQLATLARLQYFHDDQSTFTVFDADLFKERCDKAISDYMSG